MIEAKRRNMRQTYMENIMFNKQSTKTFPKIFLIGLLLLAFPLAACNTLSDTVAAAPTEQQEIVPLTSANDTAVETAPVVTELEVNDVSEETSDTDEPSITATANLTPEEIEDLLFMREEEKLARDVYLTLYEQWGIPVFQNIAASEQVHMDNMLSLINAYGLTDPVGSNAAGIFSDSTLQSLYSDLVAAGSESAADALLVGAAVEEIDILDLQGSLTQTHKEDIVAVYHNLLAGSENHLRAFVSSWERQTGETYLPQHLDAGEYAAIMDGTQGANGQGYGSGGGQGNGGNGGFGQSGSGQGQGGQGNGNRGQGKGRGGNGGQGQGANGGFGQSSQ
jgi:hypothetical protein